MVLRSLRAVSFAALVLVPVACGGRVSTMLPAPPVRSVESVTAQTVVPALYVAGSHGVFAYRLTASGSAAPTVTVGGFARIGGIATSADGALAVVSDYSDARGTGAELFVMPRPANGMTIAPSVVRFPGNHGQAVARGTDGAYELLNGIAGPGRTFAQYQVATYRPSAVTTLTLRGSAASYTALAVDDRGRSLVTTQQGEFEQYAAGAVGGGIPNASARFRSALTAIAVAPDGTVYVATTDDRSGASTIHALAGRAIQGERTIGPFEHRITALAVDADGLLYAGMSAPGDTSIAVFPPHAAGNAPPLRVLSSPVRTNDPSGAALVAIAIAQPVSPSVLQSQTGVISAANGGTVRTANGSISIPGHVLANDTPVTVRVLASVGFTPTATGVAAIGPALTVTAATAPLSPQRHVRAAALTSSIVTLQLSAPPGYTYGDLTNDIPLTAITWRDGTIDYVAFGGHFDASGNAVVQVPMDLVMRATKIELYVESYSSTQARSGGRALVASTNPAIWTTPVSVASNKKTLVFVHGVISSVENAFPCASTIVAKGGYDQAVGFNYDWSQPPPVIAPQLASFVNSLGAQKQIDIEAHSYGTINALAAIPQLHAKIQNLVLLGGPLDGTPFASEAALVSIPHYMTFGSVRAAQFSAATQSGLATILSPNSPVLGAIEAAVYSGSFAPAETIKVAGDSPPLAERAVDYAMYLDGLAHLDFTRPYPDPYDGLVPVASALSANVPAAYATIVPLDHVQLECDPSVIAYVASHLSSPSPNPTPTPSPTATPAPTPSPAQTVAPTLTVIGPTTFEASSPGQTLPTATVKWGPRSIYVSPYVGGSAPRSPVCVSTNGTSGSFSAGVGSVTLIDEPPYEFKAILSANYGADTTSRPFSCTVYLYLVNPYDTSPFPTPLSARIPLTFSYTGTPAPQIFSTTRQP